MRRLLAVFVIAGVLTAPLYGAESIRTSTTATGSVISLAIDGTFAGSMRSWDGGEPRGNIVTMTLPGDPPTKQISSLTYDPLVLQCALPPSLVLNRTISDFVSNRASVLTLTLAERSATGMVSRAKELRARLSGVQFPAVDGGTSDALYLKLIFEVEQSTTFTGQLNVGGKTAASLPSNSFSFALAGVDSSKVMRIEAFGVSQRFSSNDVGEFRVPTKTPQFPEFGNIFLTIPEPSIGPWQAWFDDFVIRDNNGQDKERSATLSFSGADFAINFSQVGIARVSRLPVTTTIAQYQVELYYEQVSLGGANVASQSLAAAAAEATPSTVTASTEIALVPSGSVASLSQTPVAVATPVAAETGIPLRQTQPLTSSAVMAATNPADTGTRDPAQFPRVSGLTRTYYNGSFFNTYTAEQAYYNSPEPIYDFVGRVSAAAKADGWTLRAHSEDSSANGKSVSMTWTKPNVSVGLNFVEQLAGGVRLQVSVSVQLK